MAGLIEALESALNGSGLSDQILARAGDLGGLITAVQGLRSGPPALGDLGQAVQGFPAPPGLDGIGALATRLSTIGFPGEIGGLVQPLIGPLTGLSGQLAGGGAARATALLDLVRELVRVTTGRVAGGPSGLPDDSGFRLPDGPSPEELRALFAEASLVLDGFGPRLDAARILEFLRRASGGFREPLYWLPQIPLVNDVMEALGTVGEWQTLSGEALTAQLTHTVELAAQLIATPRTRVADPVLQAARILVAAPADLRVAVAETTPVFGGLREKILNGGAQPSVPELLTTERTAALLQRLAHTLGPESSPLAAHETLDEELTRTLLGVLRALQPAYDLAPLAVRLRAQIAAFPAAPPQVFGQVVDAINGFDLSAVTGPLQTVTETVRGVVDQVHAARDSVRQAIEAALAPVAEALETAFTTVGFDQIRQSLEAVPATVQSFVNTQITPNLEAVRNGIQEAVSTVSTAADQFDPKVLIAPIRQAVEQAAALLQSEDVRRTFEQVDQTLQGAIQALQRIDLPAAADQSVALMADIEEKLAAIDPALIPDDAKPLLRQGVQVVTDIDFTGEVGEPLLRGLEQALEQGPAAVLGTIEESMDALRERIEAFRPSQVIGDQLDQPFRELTEALAGFRPSDLLQQLQQALDGLADRLRVFDVAGVVDPLVALHTTLEQGLESLQPSRLLQPVNDAIAAAIAKVYEATGIDTVFDGINEVIEVIQTWTRLLADARDLLTRAADLFDQPGDATTAVAQLVDDALARLDTVDLARLGEAFATAAAAVAAIDRNTLAGDLARALQDAGRHGPELLASNELEDLRRLCRAFPLDALRDHRSTPARRRLVAALEQALAALDLLDAAPPRWAELGPRLNDAAGSIQERLLDYFRVTQLEGGVFAGFAPAPTTTAALKEAVRSALLDSVQEPVTTLLTAVRVAAPYVRLLARGVAEVLGAIHAKVDSLVGDSGVGGTVQAVEDAVNLLREINLRPVTDPLDALHARLQTALAALDPEPLRAALQAVQDAVADLLRVTNLVSPADLEALDTAYRAAVDKIGQLAPSQVISQTLDPVYEQLLADILPVLDLPRQLRTLTDTVGRTLGDDAVRELARVEAAFDQMLRALPLDATGGSASVEVTGSVGVG